MLLAAKKGARASLVAQRLKRLPPTRETWARSLGREDPLESKESKPVEPNQNQL